MRSGSLNGSGADHPTREVLAALLYEGLVADEAEPVLKHLDRCAECTRRVDEMEPSLAAYARYRETVKIAEPGPWKDIWSEMRRVDAERGTIKFPAHRRQTVWGTVTGAIAAGLALVALILWPTGRSAEARAEVLLAQARKAAPAANPKKRVRVRTARASFVRPAVLHGPIPEDAEVQAKFEQAHYDFNDPLSASAYTQWREGLKSRSAKVTEDHDNAVIGTTTRDSSLIEASLTLAMPDMSVTRGVFRFADQETVEISVLPEMVGEAAPTVIPQIRPVAAAPVKSEEIPLPQRELKVWVAIDSLNAGAGAPISVEVESDGGIVVTGYSLTARREDALRASLDGIPGVAVRSADSGGAAPVDQHPGEPAINLSESIAARAHLLDRLASRFPPDVEASLPDVDRENLHAMRLKHAAQLNRDIDALWLELSRRRPLARTSAETHASADALVKTAVNVDRLVTTLYASTADSAASWPELGAELSRLRQLAAMYQRSLEPAR